MPTASFRRVAGSSVIDQHLPHDLSRNSEKMRAAAIIWLVLSDHAGVGFVNQRGGLKRVDAPFAAELGAGELAKLGINQRHQAIERSLIAGRELL